MSDLLELAGRCESALRPDCALDAEIARATWTPRPGCTVELDPERYHAGVERDAEGRVSANIVALRFTASLDAAMTLALEGDWNIEWCDGIAWAHVVGCPTNISATTPALALCAAALRARAASATETRRAETENTGSVEDEGAVAKPDAPPSPPIPPVETV